MAKTQVEAPPDSFPITLAEFVGGLPKGNVESAKAFRSQLTGDVGSKTAQEWGVLFIHFGNKPSGIAWPEWLKRMEKQAEVVVNGK